LVLSLLALYVLYAVNIAGDPEYLSHLTLVSGPSTTAFLAFFIITIALLALYFIFFTVTLFRNLYFMCTSVTPRSKALFLLSLAMMVTILATMVFGVYSPVYSNGHLFTFFLGLCNVYVWALVYLNWPAGFESDFASAYQNNATA
jgi:Wnt-binding factor required for Wnt secretion